MKPLKLRVHQYTTRSDETKKEPPASCHAQSSDDQPHLFFWVILGVLCHRAITKRPRRTSVIDTGRLSPASRSEAAAKVGLGRLFLEVGTQKRFDYFGDTVLTRKTKQVASVITTASTRCYVLNKWDLLRRVDKEVIEQVQREHDKKTAFQSDDRRLIREFQRSQEWTAYKNSLVEDIVSVKKGMKSVHGRR